MKERQERKDKKGKIRKERQEGEDKKKIRKERQERKDKRLYRTSGLIAEAGFPYNRMISSLSSNAKGSSLFNHSSAAY